MLLDFNNTLEFLKRYGIKTADAQIFCDSQLAATFAEKIGYPVALKVWGDNILHRSDIGGVLLNIQNSEELKVQFLKIQKISPQIIVQKMAQGQSVIIGMKQDPQFGPVIMFGLGGIFVEVLKDVSFRLCPITQQEAQLMIKEIKGYPILAGIRGQKPINFSALSAIIVNVSKLAHDNPQIKEIDLNPVLVDENGAVAADFKFLI